MCAPSAAVMLQVRTNLFKELQAVCVVIISEIDNSSLSAVGVEGLPQPPQCQISLHGPPGDSGVPSVTPQLIVPWCLYIEVGVVKSGFSKEPRDKRRSPLGVLHQDPVQIGNMEESISQPCQLSLLHWSTIRRGDDVNSRQHVRPRWRPRINILCPHHLHNIPIWSTVFLGVLCLAACFPLALDTIVCRLGWEDM